MVLKKLSGGLGRLFGGIMGCKPPWRRRRWLFLLCLFMVFLLFRPSFAADKGVEFGVEDDLTINGTQGNKSDADLEVKGFTVFGSTGEGASKVTSGEGSLYIQNNLELGGNTYLLGSVGIGTTEPTASLEVNGDIKIASGKKYKIGENNLSAADVGALTTVDATTVPYNVTYTTVAVALDQLFYVNPVISSFTNTVNQVEIGSTVTSTQLDWILNKTITSQSIDNGIGSLAVDLRTYTHSPISYTTNRTYKLTVFDGTNTVEASTYIYFRYRRFWGVSSSPSLTDSEIKDLFASTSELSTTRSKTFYPSPSWQYIYFAYPVSWGAASFYVNGQPNTAWIQTTIDHTYGNDTTSYYVYRHPTGNPLTGSYTIVVN